MNEEEKKECMDQIYGLSLFSTLLLAFFSIYILFGNI